MKQSIDDYLPALARFISASAGSSPAEPAHEATFEEMALSLFSFQFEQVEPYRRLCQARGLSSAYVRHWSEIPAVPTTSFKEFAITSLSSEQRTFSFHSSGTTQQRPGRHYHDAESLRLYETSLWPWFKRHILDGRTRDLCLLALTPSAAVVPHSSLVHMFDTVRRRFEWRACAFCGVLDGDGAWRLDSEACLRALEESVALDGPLLILGTAFNFVHLIEILEARKSHLKLPPGSRVMETGGYKGRSRAIPKTELHRRITELLGIPPSYIVSEYSMSEISSQAYDQVAGAAESSPARTFRFPPWARARIMSPETGREVAVGEMGLIQVFDLANVSSVMAIQTDDLAIRRAVGFELVGRSGEAEPRGCSRVSR